MAEMSEESLSSAMALNKAEQLEAGILLIEDESSDIRLSWVANLSHHRIQMVFLEKISFRAIKPLIFDYFQGL